MAYSQAKWLRWEKTRSEVFGVGSEDWHEGWAHRLVFGSDQERKHVFDVLLQGKHWHLGLGVLSIPAEWKKKRRAKRREKKKLIRDQKSFSPGSNIIRGGGAKERFRRIPNARGHLQLEINEVNLPSAIYNMRGKLFSRCETSGSGCACAIHSVFGDNRNGILVATSPRTILRDTFGETSATFTAKLDNDLLTTKIKNFRWMHVVQPYVCQLQPVLPCREKPGPEETAIAVAIAKDNPIVMRRSREAVEHSQVARRIFREKRGELAHAFSQTFTPALKEVFIIPLLKVLGIYAEYERPYESFATKLDALFAPAFVSEPLRLGVLEHRGVEALSRLQPLVEDIVLAWEDFNGLELIENFLAKLRDASQAVYQEPSEPFENFFAEIYPSYLNVISSPETPYYLSDIELLAMARIHRMNVALSKFLVDEDALQYHDHTMSASDAPFLWITIQVHGDYLGYFWRVVLKTDPRFYRYLFFLF